MYVQAEVCVRVSPVGDAGMSVYMLPAFLQPLSVTFLKHSSALN